MVVASKWPIEVVPALEGDVAMGVVVVVGTASVVSVLAAQVLVGRC